MTDFGLCRVCDSALPNASVEFVERREHHLIFRVTCYKGGHSYFADETNSLTGFIPYDQLPSVLQEGDPSSSSPNGGSDSPSGS